jgi:hypothetical protein
MNRVCLPTGWVAAVCSNYPQIESPIGGENPQEEAPTRAFNPALIFGPPMIIILTVIQAE